MYHFSIVPMGDGTYSIYAMGWGAGFYVSMGHKDYVDALRGIQAAEEAHNGRKLHLWEINGNPAR